MGGRVGGREGPPSPTTTIVRCSEAKDIVRGADGADRNPSSRRVSNCC